MYCTIADIEKSYTSNVLAQLTDDVNGSVINYALVEEVITNSSNVMDDYLRGSYTLPLVNTHAVLTKICICIVRYELAKRRSGVVDKEGLERTEYEDGLELLKNIQGGRITLDEPTTSDDSTTFSAVCSRPKVFERREIMKI